MINDIDKNKLEKQFGKLMMRRVILVNMLNSYNKEIKALDKEMTDLIDEYTKEKDDGCTVQQAQ